MASSTPPDIDFDAIAKVYFRMLQEKAGNSAPDTQMMAPDFRNVKLNVTACQWEQYPNTQRSTAAFANLTKSAQGVSGHVQAEAPLFEGNELHITSGRISDIGKTLELPLDDPVTVALSQTYLKIDPSKAEDRVSKNVLVTQSMSWQDIPACGAGVKVVRNEEFSYEGEFACRVEPKGTVMVQCAGNNIRGGIPEIQKIIQSLKKSPQQDLVKHFQEDNRGRYFWVIQGSYMINKNTSLALKN